MRSLYFFLTSAVLIALTAVGVSALTSRQMNTQNRQDRNGHAYADLWSRYEAAQNADKPKTQQSILEEIKTKALKERQAWDWWDAARRYPSIASSRNWKLRDSLQSRLADEVKAYDEPVVTFSWMRQYSYRTAADFVLDNSDALRKSSHKPFWKDDGAVSGSMSGCLTDYIRNDFEYALWTFAGDRDKMTDALKEELKDSYPAGAYLQFLIASQTDVKDYGNPVERLEALRGVERKWNGKAISLYPRMTLLEMEMDSLHRAEAGSNDYKAFLKKLQDFNSDKARFTGEEAAIVKELSAKDMISSLNAKELMAEIKDGKGRVFFRNLSSAQLTLKRDDKQVFSTVVKNPVKSFYVFDTVAVDLPIVDDGNYVLNVKEGKVEAAGSYEKYTVSLAQRRNSKGIGIYATDYLTGEPLKKVDVKMTRSGNTVATAKDFSLGEGFTQLPADFQKVPDSRAWHELSVSFRDKDGVLRKSSGLGLGRGWLPGSSSLSDGYYVKVMTDRGAYNPGDTLHYKAMLYHGDMVEKVGVVTESTDVKVEFRDSEGNVIGTSSLMSNEFGSVAGEFPIPEGLRGGMFSLEVRPSKWKNSGSRSVRVDEFVLPTFDAEFENIDRLLLPGDSVEVKGKLTSYTGHSLSAAKLAYVVTDNGKVLTEGSMNPSQDGTFSIGFKATDEQYQHIEVKVTVTDQSGETWEFSRYVFISTYLSISSELLNSVDAQVALAGEENSFPFRRPWRPVPVSSGVGVVDEPQACFRLSVRNNDGEVVPLKISYRLLDEKGKELFSGEVESGDTLKLRTDGGLFTLETEASVDRSLVPSTVQLSPDDLKATYKHRFIRVVPGSGTLDAPVEAYFRAYGRETETGAPIKMEIGGTEGPIWAVVEVYGENYNLLERQAVHVSGGRGSGNSLKTIEYTYKEAWPDAVAVNVFWFRSGRSRSYNHMWKRIRHNLDLPLEFSSFEDKTLPASRHTFTLKTAPGVEVLAAVFDKSTERIASNSWGTVRMRDFSVSAPSVDPAPGHVGGSVANFGYVHKESMARGGVLMSKASVNMAAIQMDDAAPMAYEAAEALEEEVAVGATSDAISEDDAKEVDISGVAMRSNFANMLTFQPFLRSDGQGRLSFDFTTSDKLSTYVVALYAHDKDMRNATLRRETVVTLPVKVSVAQPAYLYAGDSYSIAVAVSSVSDTPVRGKLILSQYPTLDCEGTEPVAVNGYDVEVPAGGNLSRSFDIKVPSAGAGEIGLKAAFVAEGFSDGVKVGIPVREAAQELTESHSAVLLPGMDKEALVKGLRDAFVNTSSYGAEYKEISVIDMVRDALPSKVEPESDNVLALSEALYVRLLSRQIARKYGIEQPGTTYEISDDELFGKVMACRNSDGGFGWFEGMHSSPVITAVMLERFAKMPEDAPSVDLTSSVKYLDNNQFDYERPYWCGGLSYAQYLYVRSIYPDVRFEVKGSGNLFTKRMNEFQKWVRDYLVPKKERGLNGRILDKARRLKTLSNLTASDTGIALAKAWGVTLGTSRKLSSSLDADIESLLEYAVDHKDGGMYFPNAVMPWRGLLESEAYAHSMLADLFTAYGSSSRGKASSRGAECLKVADGVRIWLMLQKETQHWDADPAFVDAVNTVMTGSDEVKATRVLVMTKSYRKPFDGIKAAGNGFRIERRFFREVTKVSDGSSVREEVELKEGDVLAKGEKVIAEYRIWNGENRSFVRVTTPREACLRSVNQLSGWYRTGIRPLSVSGFYMFTPSGYRDVKADKSVFYFDTFPEENTTLREEFFATQSGVFHAPVMEVESLYAQHYRANSASSPTLHVKQ